MDLRLFVDLLVSLVKYRWQPPVPYEAHYRSLLLRDSVLVCRAESQLYRNCRDSECGGPNIFFLSSFIRRPVNF